MPARKKGIADELRAWGLAHFPGAHLKSPWPGHLDLAVKDKTFAYLSVPGEPFRLSVKLPASGSMALMMANVQPTPYGLGKSGWISGSFGDKAPPIALLKEWIEESYRAQAPKKLVKELDGGASGEAARSPSSSRRRAAPASPGRRSKTPAARRR